MTTHQLTGAPAGDTRSRTSKAVGTIAAALVVFGGWAAVAGNFAAAAGRGAAFGQPAPSTAAAQRLLASQAHHQAYLTLRGDRSGRTADRPSAPVRPNVSRVSPPVPAAPRGGQSATRAPSPAATPRPVAAPPAPRPVRTPQPSKPPARGGSPAPTGSSSPTPGPTGSSAPAPQDPAQSRTPSSDFYANCFGGSYSASACDQSALANIDSALASEGHGPLSLPSDYDSLSMPAQLIAVANAERSVRGLPTMAENGTLDSRAYQGAQAGADPTGPSGYAWGSNLAMGYPTALSADYVWMYDDGTNSPNVDCQSAGASGCWGHRHNILIQGGGQAGAAIYDNNGTINLTQLFVVNY